jgi:hypothetical protein
MITIFISKRHTYTIRPFLKTWANKAANSIRLLPYQYLHRIRRIQPGLFIFSDIDRLTPKQRQSAIHLCNYITKNFGESLIINHPNRVLTRYRLLTQLWEDGINQFRVYSQMERVGLMQFPVFVRRIHDHSGPLTDLIPSEEELIDRMHSLCISGQDPNQLITIEFCDTQSDDQLYRKYSAFRIGDRIIPGHIIFSREWVAKDSPPEPLRHEEKAFLSDNPHQDELLQIFRLANIEYGRIDYGLLNGKIQVWEINTNPMLIKQRKKYSMDKLPIKQQLVDELADSFLSTASRTENVGAKAERATEDLPPFTRLSLFQQLDRFLHAVRL